MSSAAFKLDEGTLKVKSFGEEEDQGAFTKACDELLASGGAELVIDLTAVKKLRSSHMGIIADAHFKAKDAGKSLKLKIKEPLLKLFTITSTNEILDVEVV